jgi:hypothetical protein
MKTGSHKINYSYPIFIINRQVVCPFRVYSLGTVKHINGAQDYCIFGLCPLSDIVKNMTFQNWVCFHPQVRGWEAPTLLGPLERANLNHWIGLDWRLALSKGSSRIGA